MIISASRRTDIPGFFVDWFMDRIREGYFTSVNPFNRSQHKVVSLKPEDVDCIIFWTKYPAPLLDQLPILDELGYRYYFQFTLNDYPDLFEPKVPPLPLHLDVFRELSEKIGKEKVIWRYDPIILSNLTSSEYHMEKFDYLTEHLTPYTDRVIISFWIYTEKLSPN